MDYASELFFGVFKMLWYYCLRGSDKKMNNLRPVIIIEDDEDDQFLLINGFKQLGFQNELIFFADGLTVLKYLDETTIFPLLILSDVNIPKMNGIEIREKLRVHSRTEIRCIPFIFFTTDVSKKILSDAYGDSVQGFFIKEPSLNGWEEILSLIMSYWTRCISYN